MKNNRGFTLIKELLYLVFIPLIIGFFVAVIYINGSLLTSAVKSLSHDCGQTYAIESVVNGDWFCPIQNTE